MSETILSSGAHLRNWALSKPDIVIAVLWLTLGSWGWFLLGPIWVRSMRPAPDEVIDFYQDWGSARNFWGGLPIYTPHSISIPQYLGLPSNPDPSVEHNAHPPTSVLVVLPLGQLAYPHAALIWNIISLAAFGISMAIVATVLPVPRPCILPTLAFVPFCVPVFGNLQIGQLNLVLVLLVTAIWALERSGQSSTAGLLLGTAAAIKLFPAYLAVYYVARGRIRPLVATAFAFLALTVVTALVLDLETYHDYVSIVLPGQAKFQACSDNLSIAGLWHKLLEPTDPVVLVNPSWTSRPLTRWGIYCSDLCITFIVATVAYRARTSAERDLAFALAVTAMLLASPVTWQVTLVLLLVPIAILTRIAAKSRWMVAGLFLILPTILLPQRLLAELVFTDCYIPFATRIFMLGMPSIKFYALIGIFALGLAAGRIERGEES